MKLFSAFALAALAIAQPLSGPLIQPEELAARLRAPGAKPTLIHVGFDVLYRNQHLPKSIYAGPGSTPKGIAALKQAVASLPKSSEIVIYCGCCPWDNCPNVKPAMEALKQMGFTKVKALHIPTNIKTDWYDKGYPSEAGSARQGR